MKYKITLKPLQPFLFGGDNTFGKIGDKEDGTYKVNSRLFPQQSAILGMIKKELMVQNKLLTRKIKGEWVDRNKTEDARKFVGSEKFDINRKESQDFGVIKNISSIFLQKDNKIIIKKANLKEFPLEKVGDNYILKNFTAKDDIFDNYESLDKISSYKTEDIFISINQTLNQKKASENSLYKKTSYLLNKDFCFGFFLECEYELSDSIVTLGADRSSFILKVEKSNETLNDKNDYLLLLGDSLITLPLNEHCDFAITSEISYRNLTGKKSSMTKNSDPKKNKQNNPFLKSDEIYLFMKKVR